MFEFKKNTLTLNIADETFDVDPVLADAVIKNDVGLCAQKMSEKLSAEKNNEETIRNVCHELLSCVDKLLGEGSAKRIIKDRTINFYDCLDLLTYIIKEVQEFNRAKHGEIKKLVDEVTKK